MEITVFHVPIPGNGDRTVFRGDGVEYRMQDNGSLLITRWETGSERGDALFAPGQWIYVCRSR